MRRVINSTLVRLLGLYALTCLFLMATSPAHLPAFVLVVPFAAIFYSLYSTIMAIIHFLRSTEDDTVGGLKLRRPRVLAAVVAGFPVLLLVLQSIVELSILDVIISLVIFLLVYIYISRSDVTLFGR